MQTSTRGLLLLLILVKVAFASTIFIDSKVSHLDDFEIGYFIDNSAQMPIDEIRQQTFTPSPNKKSLGFKANHTWIKFTLKNRTPHQQKLFLHHAYGFSTLMLKFYEFSDNVLLNKQFIELSDNEDGHKMMGKNAIYNLTLEPYQTKTLYLYNETLIYTLLDFSIHNQNHSIKTYAQDTLFITLLTGFLIALSLYNFLLFMTSRYKEYLFYSLYLLTSIVWMTTLHGGVSHYFDFYGLEGYRLTTAIMLSPIFLSLFIIHFFETEKKYPKEHTILKLVITVFTSLSFLSIIDFYTASILTTFAYFLLGFVYFFIALSIFKKKHPAVKFFLYAHMFYITACIIEVLFLLDFIPFVFLTEYSSAIGGSVEAVVLAFLLIYKIKLLEEKETLLKEQSKLAALGQMIGNISHQWKQPLSELSMIQNIIIARTQLKPLSPKEIMDKTHKQQEIISFMSDTIETFENFYKESKSESFTFQEAYANTYTILQETIRLNQIQVQVNIDKNISLIGNRNEISQILLSLMQNSISFFKIRHIEQPMIHITAFKRDQHTILEICDNAGGIQKEFLHQIFNYNFSHRDTNQSSTGIGLYMVKSILEDKFNATIEAENIQYGAKFTIKFLKRDAKETALR
jgi:signal transduction histidine kinase